MGFAKIYDKYRTILTERIITNNGNHDAVFAPNWNWIDWNYDEGRGIKRSVKVAIITHFSKLQQIDEFPALLNVGEDNGYSLRSQTDHDVSCVPLNWKREMERSAKKYRVEMGTKLSSRIFH